MPIISESLLMLAKNTRTAHLVDRDGLKRVTFPVTPSRNGKSVVESNDAAALIVDSYTAKTTLLNLASGGRVTMGSGQGDRLLSEWAQFSNMSDLESYEITGAKGGKYIVHVTSNWRIK